MDAHEKISTVRGVLAGLHPDTQLIEVKYGKPIGRVEGTVRAADLMAVRPRDTVIETHPKKRPDMEPFGFFLGERSEHFFEIGVPLVAGIRDGRILWATDTPDNDPVHLGMGAEIKRLRFYSFDHPSLINVVLRAVMGTRLELPPELNRALVDSGRASDEFRVAVEDRPFVLGPVPPPTEESEVESIAMELVIRNMKLEYGTERITVRTALFQAYKLADMIVEEREKVRRRRSER